MLTDDQIRRAMVRLVGGTRNADVQCVKMLGGTPEVLGEYLWDHWMGEPDSPSLEQVQAAVRDLAGPP